MKLILGSGWFSNLWNLIVVIMLLFQSGLCAIRFEFDAMIQDRLTLGKGKPLGRSIQLSAEFMQIDAKKTTESCWMDAMRSLHSNCKRMTEKGKIAITFS